MVSGVIAVFSVHARAKQLIGRRIDKRSRSRAGSRVQVGLGRGGGLVGVAGERRSAGVERRPVFGGLPCCPGAGCSRVDLEHVHGRLPGRDDYGLEVNVRLAAGRDLAVGRIVVVEVVVAGGAAGGIG